MACYPSTRWHSIKPSNVGNRIHHVSRSSVMDRDGRHFPVQRHPPLLQQQTLHNVVAPHLVEVTHQELVSRWVNPHTDRNICGSVAQLARDGVEIPHPNAEVTWSGDQNLTFCGDVDAVDPIRVESRQAQRPYFFLSVRIESRALWWSRNGGEKSVNRYKPTGWAPSKVWNVRI